MKVYRKMFEPKSEHRVESEPFYDHSYMSPTLDVQLTLGEDDESCTVELTGWVDRHMGDEGRSMPAEVLQMHMTQDEVDNLIRRLQRAQYAMQMSRQARKQKLAEANGQNCSEKE